MYQPNKRLMKLSCWFQFANPLLLSYFTTQCTHFISRLWRHNMTNQCMTIWLRLGSVVFCNGSKNAFAWANAMRTAHKSVTFMLFIISCPCLMWLMNLRSKRTIKLMSQSLSLPKFTEASLASKIYFQWKRRDYFSNELSYVMQNSYCSSTRHVFTHKEYYLILRKVLMIIPKFMISGAK